MTLVDPIHDTIDRISWGWIAVLYGVQASNWLCTSEASRLTGLSPATLVRWAERGAISQITGSRRKDNAYLHPELEVIRRVTQEMTQRDTPPNLRLVKAHIEDVVYNGFR
ncbi:hypothetical protein [Actinomadura chibensis]|uniref:Uncharacterized protein n=1 Tax=Actinomadura chibensis TaxID=392828 RepID=A0A5D0NIL0_9ACTN|nr:hypothetical protein [Actinomadura chibensis]TYB44198.1 hypothetical protein FXF69_24935 [Actinomadura chibensis]